MKAIHNTDELCYKCSDVENYGLKYNFESNSQPLYTLSLTSSVENYGLKYNFESNSQPNTNIIESFNVENYGLKYNFESNSQQSCEQLYTFNCWELWSKIQFWKQFTTKMVSKQSNPMLRIMV